MSTTTRIIRCGLGCAALVFCVSSGAFAACPKMLMFDGVNIRTENNAQQARYWGRAVGMQGFFLNNVMADWQQDVGNNATSKAWQLTRQFQAIYAKQGVTDNFIKVAIWKPHDWRSAAQNAAVAQNFAHAAALAKFAGMKGIALDLEAYIPVWGGSAGDPQLATTIQQEGKAIAEAMHRAYPDMTLVLIQDALYLAQRKQGYHGGYGLSVPFLRGLLSVPWLHLVIATEATYSNGNIASLVKQTFANYQDFIRNEHLPVKSITVAPGLWPLGNSYTDKSARQSPAIFESRLKDAIASSGSYVWIYGFGSAWQTDGSYDGASGKPSDPVVADFPDYIRAVQQASLACQGTQ